MTPADARRTLGLDPNEDPRVHLEEFKQARERIAELVRTAPNDAIADRYQKGLVEFDQALAAIQEYLEAAGLASPPLPGPPSPALPITAPEIELASEKPDPPPRRSRTLFIMTGLLVFLTAIGGAGWIYLNDLERKREQLQTRITFLERQGSIYIENRRWADATQAYEKIENLAPSSPSALFGRRSIEAGMAEEQTQFVAYWTGQAVAELDAGRLDEAAAATRQVLEKFPDHQESTAILNRIAAARLSQARGEIVAAARARLEERDWNGAIEAARGLLAAAPEDPEVKSIIADATAALEKAAADKSTAAELLKQAAARDPGVFDQQALDLLREANTLDPENPEIAARLEKLSTYTRTLRVPGDFATPAEALAAARDRDRIILTDQVWKGPLVVNVAVDLQGSDPAKTLVECPAEDGSAITIGPDAKGARISGIGFRHESFAVGADRYSVALVRGGRAVFFDCRFSDASGHGLAIVEQGQAIVERCRASNNGWNGLAAMGEGSTLEVKNSECRDNFEHGIESWNGAAVILTHNRCEGNSRNGIHADNGLASATITGNQLTANREFGLVLGSAGSGEITGNIARANLLGGIVIRAAAANSSVTKNQATLNQGPGLILQKGLPAAAYADNQLTKNSGQQLLTEANLSQPDEIPAKQTGQD
jgi:tetratricopeptide (TPR) repeat protein